LRGAVIVAVDLGAFQKLAGLKALQEGFTAEKVIIDAIDFRLAVVRAWWTISTGGSGGLARAGP
jgi:hypothetical protein